MLWSLPWSAAAAPAASVPAPFTATPAELLAAAAAAPPEAGEDARLLLEEIDVALLPAGLVTTTIHRVLVVRTAAAVDDWGVFGSAWSPWFEDRPTLRARVVAPDGTARELDPAHVAEVAGESGDTIDDDRVVRAPLPGLVPGAVVEEEVVTTRHAPFFAGGEAWAVPLRGRTPTEVRRLRVDAAPGVPFTWTVPDGVAVDERRSGGHRLLSVERRGADASPGPPAEPDRPWDPPAEVLAFSTARDWAAIVAAYEPLVDAALAGVDLAERARRARGDATDRGEILRRLVAETRSLRYVAVELGATGIVPRSPEIALRNGYGDCKDKALLLVGLLRASGIPAHVAMVRTGPGPDLVPIPGLDGFDHQIVFLPDDEPHFVDPTAEFTPVGELPWPDQGRQTLVIAPGVTGLRTTPVAPSSATAWDLAIDVTFGPGGVATGTITSAARGAFGGAARAGHADVAPAELRAHYERRAADLLAGALDGEPVVEVTPDRFVARTRVRDLERATADGDAAAFAFSGWDVVTDLPEWLRTDLETPLDRVAPVRLLPWRNSLRLRVAPPEGLVVDALPQTFDWTFGPVRWTQSVAAEADGAVAVDVVLDLGDGRLEAADAERLRERIALYAKEPLDRVTFADPARVAWEKGERGPALRLARERARAATTAAPSLTYAGLLVQAGFRDGALAELDGALLRHPDDVALLRERGRIRLADPIGTYGTAHGDPAGARADLERALALAPDDREAARLLAIAWEPSPRRGIPGDLARSADLLLAWRKATGDASLDGPLAHHLAELDRLDALESVLPDFEPAAGRAWRVAVAALRGGPEAARAVPLARDQRGEQVQGMAIAASLHAVRREYPEATALFEAAAGTAADARMAPILAMMRRAVRFDEAPHDDADPADVAVRAVVRAAAGDLEGLRPLASRSLREVLEGETEVDPGSQGVDLFGFWDHGAGFEDLTASVCVPHADGSAEEGWRVDCGAPQLPTVFLVAERGKARVRALGTPGEVAEEALRRRLADAPGAERWAAWAWSLAPDGDTAHTLLRPTAPELALRAALALGPDRAAAQLAPLQKARAGAEGPVAEALDRAIFAAAVVGGRWAEVERLLPRFLEVWAAHPEAVDLAAVAPRLARGLPDPVAAHALVAAAAAAHPDHEALSLFSLDLAERALPFDELAAAWRERMATAGGGPERGWNDAAWAQALEPAHHPDAIAWATRANELGQYRQANALHTLATLLGLEGRGDEAWTLLMRVQADPAVERAPFALVQGLVAEAWGLPEVAAERYAAVGPPRPGRHVLEEADVAATRAPR